MTSFFFHITIVNVTSFLPDCVKLHGSKSQLVQCSSIVFCTINFNKLVPLLNTLKKIKK